MRILLIFVIAALVSSCGKEPERKRDPLAEALKEMETHDAVKAENEKTLEKRVLDFCRESHGTVEKFTTVIDTELKMYNAMPEKDMNFIAKYTNLNSMMKGVGKALDRYDLEAAKDRSMKALKQMEGVPERKETLDKMRTVFDEIIAWE